MVISAQLRRELQPGPRERTANSAVERRQVRMMRLRSGKREPGPPSMVSALVHLAAAMSPEMTLQIASLHAAIVRCSASRSRPSPASLGSGGRGVRDALQTVKPRLMLCSVF